MDPSAHARSAAETLWIGRCTPSKNRLHLTFGVGELSFSTTVWYEDVHFGALAERHGEEFIDKLVFHIAAFEANKLYSLRPESFDPGPYERFVTKEFVALWQRVILGAWADWRYQHGRPFDEPPQVRSATTAGSECRPVQAHEGPVASLVFCGGGKDSLVMMRVLEAAEVPYATLAYSHSIYGTARDQHALIDELLDHASPRRRHRQWVIEDFMDSPVARVRPEFDLRRLTAAETPGSLFAALPIALAHGYRYLLVGHERSADLGNLVWSATGEEVNHQWGKSLIAERLLQEYIHEHLIENVTYCSLLKPMSDSIIFNSLEPDDRAVKRTHSCNQRKPWCESCPKCAYVWLGYCAYLPEDLVREIFHSNLFDLDVNQTWFRQLLGLEAHTPFECVGGVMEARLMFEICRRKGIGGRAMESYVNARLPLVDGPTIEGLMEVRLENHAMPAELLGQVSPLLVEAGDRARRKVLSLRHGSN